MSRIFTYICVVSLALLSVTHVYAQTATPTATPFVPALVSQGGQWVWSYGINALSGKWIGPNAAVGFPDHVYAENPSSTGLPTLQLTFPSVEPVATWGALQAIRIVVQGNGYDNMMVRPNNNGTDICTAQSLTGSGYTYYTFTKSSCGSLDTFYIYNGTFMVNFTYNNGSAVNAGFVDAVGYIPVFANSPQTVNTVVTDLTSSTPVLEFPAEICQTSDFFCNMRNWFIATINTLFGIKYTAIESQINTLYGTLNTKVPFAYLTTFSSLSFGSSTGTASAIPAFNLVYQPKLKIGGVLTDITPVDLSVDASQFAPLQPFVTFFRGFAKIVVYGGLLSFFLYIAKHTI
jgi:hypothetical protein